MIGRACALGGGVVGRVDGVRRSTAYTERREARAHPRSIRPTGAFSAYPMNRASIDDQLEVWEFGWKKGEGRWGEGTDEACEGATTVARARATADLCSRAALFMRASGATTACMDRAAQRFSGGAKSVGLGYGEVLMVRRLRGDGQIHFELGDADAGVLRSS